MYFACLLEGLVNLQPWQLRSNSLNPPNPPSSEKKNSENIAIFDHSSIICWSSITCCCASATSSGKTSTWKQRNQYVCQGRSTPYIGNKLIPPLIGILMMGIQTYEHLAGILLTKHTTQGHWLKLIDPKIWSSWWLNQPIWKICSSNWIISSRIGVNINNIWVVTTQWWLRRIPPDFRCFYMHPWGVSPSQLRCTLLLKRHDTPTGMH